MKREERITMNMIRAARYLMASAALVVVPHLACAQFAPAAGSAPAAGGGIAAGPGAGLGTPTAGSLPQANPALPSAPAAPSQIGIGTGFVAGRTTYPQGIAPGTGVTGPAIGTPGIPAGRIERPASAAPGARPH